MVTQLVKKLPDFMQTQIWVKYMKHLRPIFSEHRKQFIITNETHFDRETKLQSMTCYHSLSLFPKKFVLF